MNEKQATIQFRPHGWCELCKEPLYFEHDTVFQWGPHPTNPLIGNVIVSRRCRDTAKCAGRCNAKGTD